MSQDNFLFSGTVRENIRMGRPDATDEEVEKAARDCGCYDFITELENGFDTVVGSAAVISREGKNSVSPCESHAEKRPRRYPR